MKILITGNTSMLGRRLRTKLSQNHSVSMAGRCTGSDLLLDLSGEYNRGQFYGLELEVIIHCAASFSGNQPRDMVENELVNSVGALRIGQVAETVQCQHIIYISSTFSYDVPENGYFGSYGLSKRHAQENLDLLCRLLGIGFTAFLPSQIYDELGEARKHQGLFYHILDCARIGKDVTLFGTQDPERNFLFIDDFIWMVEKVVSQKIYGIFPCVHPKSSRISEVANTAFEVFGMGGRTTFIRDKPNIPTVFTPDGSRTYSK